MAWTFIDMMKSDTATAAAAAAGRVSDPRLTAFHDPAHRLGRAMARCLGWQHHVAWDTYFVYRVGTRWIGGEMPAPDFWYHQLQDREVWEEAAEAEFQDTEWTTALAEKSEADPAHFTTGLDLRVAFEGALAAAVRLDEAAAVHLQGRGRPAAEAATLPVSRWRASQARRRS